jgi:hypothetical protein
VEFVASYHRSSIATERLRVVLRQNVERSEANVTFEAYGGNCFSSGKIQGAGASVRGCADRSAVGSIKS